VKSAGHDTRCGKNSFLCKRLHGVSANGAAPRGGGWVGRGEPGWIWGLAGRVGLRRGRCKYVPVSSVAASMRLTPLRSPTRPASDTFRRFRPPRKEERRARAKAAFRVTAGLDQPPTPRRSDRSHPRMAWIYRVDQGRHLPTVTGKLSKAGRCRMAGCPRHGCRGQAPRDGFTASPPSDTSPPPHAETQSRFWLWLWPLRVQGAALPNTLRCARRAWPGATRNEKAAFRRLLHYFSLISRRRSSRKPWAVIASGYRLGLSGVMHDGSTSIRKSGFGCRKNGTE